MTEKRAILVICDGLRSDLLTPDLTPNLCRLAANGRRFMAHRSVFPSTDCRATPWRWMRAKGWCR
jgi:phosphonoacetate hydrolase